MNDESGVTRESEHDGAIVFDIETGPLPEPALSSIVDRMWTPPKTGNTKDEAKILAKHAESRQKAIDKAALNPMTGRILAIGYYSPTKKPKPLQVIDCVSEGTDCDISNLRIEHDLLSKFWSIAIKGRPMLGWNIKGFDLPFLIQRSAILGVEIPRGAINGRYFSSTFIDVMSDRWSVGRSGPDSYVSLDAVAIACGLIGKPPGVDGSMFAGMFLAGGSERQDALAYLERDITLPWEIAIRTGY